MDIAGLGVEESAQKIINCLNEQKILTVGGYLRHYPRLTVRRNEFAGGPFTYPDSDPGNSSLRGRSRADLHLTNNILIHNNPMGCAYIIQVSNLT